MTLPLLYRHTAGDDSLMSQNDLLFRPSTQEEVEAPDAWGMKGTPITPSAAHSDTVVVTLLIALLCGMTDWRHPQRVLIALLFCVQVALLALITARYIHLASPIVPNWELMLAYALVMFAYLALKQGLYHWVNNIFFTKDQRAKWRTHFTSVLRVETIATSPVVLMFVFLRIDILLAFEILAGVLLFVKIWLLLRCFSVFFKKKHGILHLFVYFCTLEGAPIVVLCTSLIEITSTLTHL
jgi:hypothetical protein